MSSFNVKIDLQWRDILIRIGFILVTTAIITYVRMHFNATPSEFDKLRGAYEMQKAQMMNATGYTNWGGTE
jgi:hypothetical protein